MMVTNVWSDHSHGVSKSEEIFIVSTAGANTAADLVGNIRHWSGAHKERVCRCANVDIKFKWTHTSISRMKHDVNCLVAPDFAKIKMLPNVCFL